MEAFLVLVVIFGSLFGIFYMYFSTRHKERMSLIEKGQNVDLFKSSKKKTAIPMYAIILINLGILGLGIGVGIILGSTLSNGAFDEEVAFPASILLCIGASLLAGFFVTKSVDDKYRSMESDY